MLSPSFVQGAKGRLFIQQFLPQSQSPSETVFLLLPPFAEELNKSRRMLALMGRALAEQGMAGVLPDLYGTGDSGGDFSDADWQTWQSDLTCSAQILLDQGAQRIVLIGLRMGCLLAAEWLKRSELAVERLIFWQPVLSGQQLVNQFLRLRLAASMMSGQQRETMADLRQILSQQGELEVAGYTLSQSLIESLDQLRLETLMNACEVPVHWIEVQSKPDLALPLPVQKLRQQWADHAMNVHCESVVGEAFWSTQEIAEVPPLIEITRQIVCPADA